MNFETVKRNYEKGLWTISLVQISVQKGIITKEEYKKITGKDYVSPSPVPTPDPSQEERIEELENQLGALTAAIEMGLA